MKNEAKVVDSHVIKELRECKIGRSVLVGGVYVTPTECWNLHSESKCCPCKHNVKPCFFLCLRNTNAVCPYVRACMAIYRPDGRSVYFAENG